MHVVADRPVRLPAPLEARLLEVPRAAQRAEHGAGPEGVERLPDPGAGRVLRGRDADVVPAVVLDVEVAVEALRERDLGQPALVLLLLVPELVRGVDADAGDHPDRQRQADPVDERQPAVGDHPAAPDQRGVLDREVEVGDPAVVAVVLQRLDHVVRRVAAVEAGEQVDGRHDPEDHDRADPPPHPPAGERVRAPRRRRPARAPPGRAATGSASESVHSAVEPSGMVEPASRAVMQHLQIGLQKDRECKPIWQAVPRSVVSPPPPWRAAQVVTAGPVVGVGRRGGVA